jgi:hypothetical protein
MKKTIELGAKVAERGLEILAREGGDPGDYRALARAYAKAWEETAPEPEPEPTRPAGAEVHERALRILAERKRDASDYQAYLQAAIAAEDALRAVAAKPKGDRFDEEIRSIKAALDRLAPKDETYTVEARERFTVRAVLGRVV